MSGLLAHSGLLLAGSGAPAADIWNTAIATDLSYSDGGKTVAGSAVGMKTTYIAVPVAVSAMAYFEFVVNSIAGSSDPPQIGLVAGTSMPTSLAGLSTGWCYLLSRGWFWAPAPTSYSAGKPAFASTDRGMVAINRAANKIWYGKSNVFQGDPAAGTGEAASNLSGTLYIAATVNNTCSLTVFTKAADFAYSPPGGYSAFAS